MITATILWAAGGQTAALRRGNKSFAAATGSHSDKFLKDVLRPDSLSIMEMAALLCCRRASLPRLSEITRDPQTDAPWMFKFASILNRAREPTVALPLLTPAGLPAAFQMVGPHL